MTHLLIFALNEPVTVSHTHLTRQKGEVADLPPLVDWLGLEALDEGEIELFPLENLGAMSLSDYIQLAFAPERAIQGDVQARLDALAGAVLLVPQGAMTGTPAPGPQATLVAEIPLAEADHQATLPKADVTAAPAPAAPTEPAREKVPPIALYALLAMAALAVIIILFGWG